MCALLVENGACVPQAFRVEQIPPMRVETAESCEYDVATVTVKVDDHLPCRGQPEYEQ